jgi:hypothetical protein
VHLPGHAPGLIGLWRESDRIVPEAATSFFTLDMLGRDRRSPTLPIDGGYNSTPSRRGPRAQSSPRWSPRPPTRAPCRAGQGRASRGTRESSKRRGAEPWQAVQHGRRTPGAPTSTYRSDEGRRARAAPDRCRPRRDESTPSSRPKTREDLWLPQVEFPLRAPVGGRGRSSEVAALQAEGAVHPLPDGHAGGARVRARRAARAPREWFPDVEAP